MARCLNCAEGPTDTPCGKCESCKDLATGGSGSLDVVEIDAASHNGVDDARELRERAGFAPVRDRFKIFILDEAHMVTQQGFNALLKIVEEPPEHVKFIFATTEPDKVIGTIRSRTHHYPFRLVPPETMEQYMAKLCQAEDIEPDSGVLQLVMRAGAGSVRDSLSVLDQLMAGAEDGKLAYGTAVALLGYTDSSILERSVDAIIDRDGAALFEVIAKMVEGGHEPRRYLEDLLLHLRDLLVLSVSSVEDTQTVLAGTPADQLAVMQAQAQRWGTAGISHASDLTNTALTELTGATAPRLQVELLAARLLLPDQSQVAAGGHGSAPSGSLSGAEAAMAALHRPGRERPRNTANARPDTVAPRTPKAPTEPAAVAPRANPVPAASPTGSGASELAAPRPQSTEGKPSSPAVGEQTPQQEQAPRNEVAEQEPSPKEGAASSSPRQLPAVEKGEQYWQLLESWGKVSARLRDTDQRLWSTCNRHLQLGGAQNQQVTLLADTAQTVEYLADRLGSIEKCLQEALSAGWTVQVVPGSDDRRAPAMSEVLSRFKLDASSGVEKTVSQEAPPEEEEYLPEPADPADGSEEISYPGPGDGEENPAPASRASVDAANAIAETAGETQKATDKPAGKPESESEPAPQNADWIIANPTASESVSRENDQDTEIKQHQVAPETVLPPAAAPLSADPAPFSGDLAAPRPTISSSPAPGSDNSVMAAPRDWGDEPAAPRADQPAVPLAPSIDTPLAAPREQASAQDIPAAPRQPVVMAEGGENISPAPEVPASFEGEDIPDLSDPDVSLEESGGRWGVEVAKSLLGGKIIETVDISGGSGKAGI